MLVRFIGLGAIGAPMAAHLAQRWPLTVWNRTAARATEFANWHGARTFVSETLVPERVLTGRWPLTFRLALLEEDVGIACGILAQAGAPGPVIELAGQLFSAARAQLGESADYLEAIKLIEQAAGVEIRD
jgi:3-hydroxyisobutyrate dehydrogenase-like beta-hydroxyacid dehydrogenase